MSIEIRRVVTGHARDGSAKVIFDDIPTNIVNNRLGCSSVVVWSTEGFPVDNQGDDDPTIGTFATTRQDGTVFRIVRYEPGVTPRNHRTDSIDYAVVMSGKIDMELDKGEVATIKAGDILIQRGTIHNWVNRYDEVCVIAFVLISATPVKTADGQVLEAAH